MSVTDEPVRLNCDSIDAEPRDYDWSEHPNVEWGEGSEDNGWRCWAIRTPEEGDEATCNNCSEKIVYQDDRWVHTALIELGEDGWREEIVAEILATNNDQRDYDEASATAALEAMLMEEDGDIRKVADRLNLVLAGQYPECCDDDDADPRAEPDAEYESEGDLDGPMMNYWYPCSLDDPTEAAKLIVDLPLCVVQVDGEYGFALTGGGMDMSWDICKAYILCGFMPPFHYASNLPKMAGRVDQTVLDGARRSCTVQLEWAQRALARLEETERWYEEYARSRSSEDHATGQS